MSLQFFWRFLFPKKIHPSFIRYERNFLSSTTNNGNEIEKTNPIKMVANNHQNKQIESIDKKKKTKDLDLLRHQKSILKIDPRDTSVFLFPGQGSQFVGMGSAIFEKPNIEKLFSTAKLILGYDLLKLCLEGPLETLSRTEYCQPAIFVTSLAGIEYLRHVNPTQVEVCVSTAGFSLGEITALVFAGAMSYEDGLRLIKIRAEAMQYATEIVPSALCTVFLYADAQLGIALQAAREWCRKLKIPNDHSVCSVSNYLFPHCKVIGGHEEAIKFLELNGSDFGIKKMRRLQVSGAFHTPLMKPAQKVLEEVLKKIKLEIPLIPVYSNYDAKIYRNTDDIRKKLTLQVCSPVKWEQILHEIYDRSEDVPFPTTYECGPGTAILSTLAMVNRLARKHSKHVQV